MIVKTGELIGSGDSAFSITSPTQLDNIFAWYDASDAASVTIATGVSQWNDKSGNARHFTQAIGVNQPSYETSQQNGLNTILFDGINDALRTAGVTLANRSYIIAAQLIASTAGNHDILTSESAPYYEYYLATNVAHTFTTGDNNHGLTVDTAFRQRSIVFGVSSVNLYSDGVAQTPGTNVSTASVSAPLSLGSFQGTSSWTNIRIGEIIIVSGEMTDVQRIAAQNYLKSRWATP